MARTNWKYNDTVTEMDMNQLGQEVNEAVASLAAMEEQVGEAEQNSKDYTDQQIQLVTATGIPKLVTYQYVLMAYQQGQTDFEIPLETFVRDTDTVIVVQNSTVLSTDRYRVEGKKVRLNEGVGIGTEIFLQILKNVPIGPEGAVSAAVLANNTVTESKMADEMKKDIPGGVAGYDAFNAHMADNTSHGIDGRVLKSGDTMTGKLNLPASTANSAPLNIPIGVAPTNPVNGDIWRETEDAPIKNRRDGRTNTFWDEGNAPLVSQAEAEAGTNTNTRTWTPLRVAQAIKVLNKITDSTTSKKYSWGVENGIAYLEEV